MAIALEAAIHILVRWHEPDLSLSDRFVILHKCHHWTFRSHRLRPFRLQVRGSFEGVFHTACVVDGDGDGRVGHRQY